MIETVENIMIKNSLTYQFIMKGKCLEGFMAAKHDLYES